jgi:(2Fe-2S) ferredoxin
VQRPGAIQTCYVCVHVWCAQGGSLAFKRALQLKLAGSPVEVREFVCLGCCPKAPNIMLYPEGTWYTQVKVEDLPEIVAHIQGGEPSPRLTGRADPVVGDLILKMLDRYVERGSVDPPAVGRSQSE